MIEDTQTPPIDKTEKSEPTLDEHWNDVELMNRSSQAAQRINEQAAADQAAAAEAHDTEVRRSGFQKGVATTLITVAALGGAGYALGEATKAPTFSEQTKEYVVEPGDGILNAAEHIKGIDSIDPRDAVQHISVDPANIDVLKDGLQPGEVLEIPDSVQK